MAQKLPRIFSRSLAADLDAPAAARCALQRLNGHVEEDLVERGLVVVSELVTNSVRHAGLSPVQQIDLRVSARRELLRLEVTDDGDGFDPAATKTHPNHSPGGWGLEIVAQLTDDWGVDFSHSTRVWCEFMPRTPSC